MDLEELARERIVNNKEEINSVLEILKGLSFKEAKEVLYNIDLEIKKKAIIS